MLFFCEVRAPAFAWYNADMATYAISDIHGAYEEFQRLLDKIRFRYDGSDSLYLLGDYGDWGEQSMETILAVKRLDEEYDFVHCLMGNHELMFLSAIEEWLSGKDVEESEENWLNANHGWVTWEAYLSLPQEEQLDLREWLYALPFSCDILVDGRRFMAAHAYPFFDDVEATPRQRQRARIDAVWRRLLPRENPFAGYTGEKNYSMLICGHTITDYYYQETNRQAGHSLADVLPAGHNCIYRSERFVDIDCGAKCMSFDGSQGSVYKAAADRAQLAAYCLETDEDYYVSRPLGPVGELMLGEHAPELLAPELDFSELYPPEQRQTVLGHSLFSREEVDYPELAAPQVRIPEFMLPERGTAAAKRIAHWAERKITGKE